jgi:hypothetical protein
LSPTCSSAWRPCAGRPRSPDRRRPQPPPASPVTGRG